MRKQVLIFLILVLTIYPVSIFFALFLNPAPLANILGFSSLVSYIATLLPSILKAIFPSTRKSKILTWLLKYRRYVGVAAFSLGLNHGILLIIGRHLNLFNFHTYLEYFQGFSTLFIFTSLALTSNDEAVKNLKKNWKKIHQLTYLAIFILPWHILDKMSGHWTYITPLAITFTIVVAVLFILKQRKEGFSILQIKAR